MLLIQNGKENFDFDKNWQFRKIEEFIDPKFDMIYYNRFYNQEITAGSYIAKNTNWTIKYLRGNIYL